MEKGFNDDELADIMSEIESLEQEFAADDAAAHSEPNIDEVAASVAQLAEEEEMAMEEEAPVAEVSEPAAEIEEFDEFEEFEEPQEIEEPAAQVEEIVASEEFDHESMIDEPTEEEIAMAMEEETPVVIETPVSEHEEVLEQLSQMPVEDVVPSPVVAHVDDNIHHMKVEGKPMSHKPAPKHGHTSMSFSVEGDMKLDLSFVIGQSEVKLHVSEDGFEIELEGGAKFTLPVQTPYAEKKVA